jgi:hypothetical protein
MKLVNGKLDSANAIKVSKPIRRSLLEKRAEGNPLSGLPHEVSREAPKPGAFAWVSRAAILSFQRTTWLEKAV